MLLSNFYHIFFQKIKLCISIIKYGLLPYLFYSNALCKISRFINIKSLCNRYIVPKQLQRNHCQTTNEVLIHLWNIYREVYLIFNFILTISSEPHQIRSTALALQHIADSLFVEFALGKHTDDQCSLLD